MGYWKRELTERQEAVRLNALAGFGPKKDEDCDECGGLGYTIKTNDEGVEYMDGCMTCWINALDATGDVWEEPEEDVPTCIRCGKALTPERCDDEFLETGICADCWLPEDEYDRP